jgi:hypothetical protein
VWWGELVIRTGHEQKLATTDGRARTDAYAARRRWCVETASAVAPSGIEEAHVCGRTVDELGG